MRFAALILSLLACIPLLSVASNSEHRVRDLPPMNANRAAHTATALADGSVIVIGGFAAEENELSGVEVFEPKQQRFATIGNAITPRQSHTASLLPNGRVLIAGGYDASGTVLDTAEIFDPVTRGFSRAGRMRVPRGEHTSVALSDGRIAFIGGKSTGWTFLDSIEIFDPTTGSFSVAGRMTVPRTSNVSISLSDGRIFIVGGSTGRRSSLSIYASSEIFDPRTGLSTPAADMATPRHKHDGIALADGRILITGGSSDQDARAMYKSAEIFDPSRNKFTPAGAMNHARYKHRGSSVLLPNGNVFIAGGAAQPEIYDATRGTFALVSSESSLHGSFSAVAVLADHRVLLTGGYHRPDAPSRGAWVFSDGRDSSSR